MSAFEVSKATIDALVLTGLSLGDRSSPMTWHVRDLTDEEKLEAYAPGAPWGPKAVELSQGLRRQLTIETASSVGAMLWAENRRSVNHRYNEDEWEEPYLFDLNPGWVRSVRGRVDPSLAIGPMHCYEYQSCEHPGWADSEAHHYIAVLKVLLLRALKHPDAPYDAHDVREIIR